MDLQRAEALRASLYEFCWEKCLDFRFEAVLCLPSSGLGLPSDEGVGIAFEPNSYERFLDYLESILEGPLFHLERAGKATHYPLAQSRLYLNGTTCLGLEQEHFAFHQGIYLNFYPISFLPKFSLGKWRYPLIQSAIMKACQSQPEQVRIQRREDSLARIQLPGVSEESKALVQNWLPETQQMEFEFDRDLLDGEEKGVKSKSQLERLERLFESRSAIQLNEKGEQAQLLLSGLTSPTMQKPQYVRSLEDESNLIHQGETWTRGCFVAMARLQHEQVDCSELTAVHIRQYLEL